MNLIKLKNEKNIYVKDALKFLIKLAEQLQNVTYIQTDCFVIFKDKVSYFDISSNSYKLYDFAVFNTILTECYYETKIYPKIKNNILYFCIKDCFNYVFSCNNFAFYSGVFQIDHLVIWFFKCLRLSREGNMFDVRKILDNFPFPFLESRATIEENVNIIIETINLMVEKKIITITEYRISFLTFDIFEIEQLIYFSFENLVFGGDFLEKTIVTPLIMDYELFNLRALDNLLLQDYIFNYVVAQATNYITYDNCSNNIYSEYTPQNFLCH